MDKFYKFYVLVANQKGGPKKKKVLLHVLVDIVFRYFGMGKFFNLANLVACSVWVFGFRCLYLFFSWMLKSKESIDLYW